MLSPACPRFQALSSSVTPTQQLPLDSGEDVPRAVQLPALQLAGKLPQSLVPVPTHRLEQSDQAGEAGAGHTGVGESDLALKFRLEQVRPVGYLSGGEELGVVDEHHRQGGEGGPQPVLGAIALRDGLLLDAHIGLEAVSIDLQTVHTAPEHHVGGGSLCPARWCRR